MKANEFVKLVGITESKRIVRDNEILGRYRHLNVCHVDLVELYDIVESHDLVEIHGYEKSKEIVANAPSDDCCFSWKIGEFYDKTVNIGELKKAIADIESCGGVV